MCACRGLLQQPNVPSLASSVSRHRVKQQLARPTGQLSARPVRGLPALAARRHIRSRTFQGNGVCHAAAEAAAVSQGPGSNPSGSSSSSSPSAAAPAASVAGSSASISPTPPATSVTANGTSSSNSSTRFPPPGPTAAGTASSSPAGPPGAAAAAAPFSLKPVYVLIFTLLFLGGLLFASMSLQLTSDMGFRDALTKVIRRIFRSIAFRQLVVITACILLVRFALNNVLRFLARWSSSPVQWDKSKLYYVMKEVYSPLELLLFIAGCCTIADSFVPQLVNVPKATVNQVVRAVLSMSFVTGASVVVYNLKSRFCKEQAWNCEMQGDITSQRRWEAYDKLGTFAIYVMGVILVIQALGLEVRSVLAIGGIGGLAIGLAGREICENLLNGFLLMTTMPFEVGEEVMFRPKANEMIEGIVVDVGWYRTLIRSFEREMYVIPNAVFSKNTVLNVTRKAREWRFYEYLCVRVQDVHKVNAIIQDIRRIVRNDARIMNKLHRRVFLDKIGMEDVKMYISFYVEASNRDAFMAVKQDLLLAFVDCVERNGGKLAQPRTVLEVDPMDAEALLPRMSAMGLLPAPGGGGWPGAYVPRGMGPSNIPITVQVVDSVEVTPIDPPPSNGSNGGGGGSSNGKDGATKGSSSSKGSSGGATGKAAGAGEQQQQQPQQQLQQPSQQQQQPLQPSVAYAGAAAAAGGTTGGAGGGRVMDAAGMAAGSNAQRKGAGGSGGEGASSSSSIETGIGAKPTAADAAPTTSAAGTAAAAGTSADATGSKPPGQEDSASTGSGSPTPSSSNSSSAGRSSSPQPAKAAAGKVPGNSSTTTSSTSSNNGGRSPTGTPASGTATGGSSSSSSSSRPQGPSGGSSSRSGGSSRGSSSSSSSGSSSVPSSRSGSPYTVITLPGSPTTQQRPDSVTILASFEDL